MGIDRRTFLKGLGVGVAGIAPGCLLSPGRGHAKEASAAETKEFMGVLVDTTRCVGCRSCEAACAEAHGFPVPDIGDSSALDRIRPTSEKQWTVVNSFK